MLGISVDSSFSQKTFADSLKLPYPLLSDFPDSTIIRRYGVLRPHPKDPKQLVAQRSFFLIDEQGIIRGKWLVKDGIVFPSEPILEVARSILKKA